MGQGLKKAPSTATAPTAPVARSSTLFRFFGAFEKAMSTSKTVPPQVVISCYGRKKAYGRERLKQLGYTGLAQIFKQDFGVVLNNHSPSASNTTLFATFIRTHGHGDQEVRVPFNEGSWEELIGNIAKIELVQPFAYWIHVGIGMLVILLVALWTFFC